MSSISLTARLTRVAAGGMLYSILTNGMIYIGQIIIARELLRSDYANFSVLISLISLVAMFADLGWTPHLIKRFAQAEAERERGATDTRGTLLGTVLLLKAILAALSAVVAVAVAFAVYGADMGYLSIICVATFFVSSRMMVVRTVMESFVRAEGGFDKVLKLAALDACAFAILLVAWSQFGLSLTAVIAIYSFCHIPGFLLLIGYLRDALASREIKLSYDRDTAKAVFFGALPLTIGVCFLTMHSMADTLILERLSDDHQVSAFAASFRLMAGLSFLPGVAAGVVIPDVIKLLKQEAADRAERLATVSMQSLLTVAVFIALLISALAPILINIILGDRYSDAGPLIVIFAWMFVPIVFASFMLELGIAVEKQKVYGYYTFVLALVTIVGDLLLAGPYGALGVILVKFAAILIGCVVLTLASRRDATLRNILGGINWTKNIFSIVIPLLFLALMLKFEVPTIVAGLITSALFLGWSVYSGLIDMARLSAVAKTFTKR
jgi:O-antigen/teichoic acid export membrane protein